MIVGVHRRMMGMKMRVRMRPVGGVRLGIVEVETRDTAKRPDSNRDHHRAHGEFEPSGEMRWHAESGRRETRSDGEYDDRVSQSPPEPKLQGRTQTWSASYDGRHRNHVIHLERVCGAEHEGGHICDPQIRHDTSLRGG